MQDYPAITIQNIHTIRQNIPLVHNITNYVVMNTTANALLSVGASPVMAHAVEEVEEMVELASALVINIGTLSDKWIEAMLKAGKSARQNKKPVVLDPVGAGATGLRTDTAVKILHEAQPTIVRGNASEILALAQSELKTRGVDSTTSSDTAVEAARALARKTGSTVTISGKVDYIISQDSETVVGVNNGTPMMGKITGTGCMSTAITGAFAAVNQNALQAAVAGMVVMGVAGEMAGEQANAPGSFQTALLDALYQVNEQEINARAKIQ
ncbi:MAG: hydroxyethylthiazole kinase [Caldithrix sp.]|nr:hydroxyethylthiazole kinase [Caldithrix sp.]